jgi:hypothetical protein
MPPWLDCWVIHARRWTWPKMDDEIAKRNAEMVAQYRRVMDGEPLGPGPLVAGIDEGFAAWLAARGIGESLRRYAAARASAPVSPIFRALNRDGQRIGLLTPQA